MPMSFVNRIGLRIIRLGMRMAGIDMADLTRFIHCGRISTCIGR